MNWALDFPRALHAHKGASSGLAQNTCSSLRLEIRNSIKKTAGFLQIFVLSACIKGRKKNNNLLFLCSDQVQQELSRVVGSRQVRVDDRKSLPFVDAVIHETQRLGNIAPLAVPHQTSQDVTFKGYFIKKVVSRSEESMGFHGIVFFNHHNVILFYIPTTFVCCNKSLAKMLSQLLIVEKVKIVLFVIV